MREYFAETVRSMYIQAVMDRKNAGEMIPLPCACANLRRAARIVTQRYEQRLRPSGLKATQFTLLQALAIAGNISQGRLGDLLGLDSTTLTRTLALLRKKGWIQAKPGEDRREIRLTLTAEGRRKYQDTLQYWQSAQKQLRKVLGEAVWKQIMEATVLAAGLAQKSG